MRPGRVGAVVIVLALAGGVMFVAGRSAPPPAPAAPPPPLPVSLPDPEVHPRSSTSPSRSATSTSVAREQATGPDSVLRGGMSAWGRFAVTGNLDLVEPWFWRKGPQWSQFVQEAPELAEQPLGDPPYSVAVEEQRVTRDHSTRRVEARISFVRTGEASQTFEWVVVLRQERGNWKIWTVEER